MRWDGANPGTALPTLGGTYTAAYDVDGSTIVGCSMRDGTLVAVSWDSNGQIREIGSLGGNLSVATSILGDTVVGFSSLASDQDGFISETFVHER